MSAKENTAMKKELLKIEKSFSLSHSLTADGLSNENGYENFELYEADVLSQFQANLKQVEALTKKLRFVVSEVNLLVKHR